jgi:hypothetical protein
MSTPWLWYYSVSCYHWGKGGMVHRTSLLFPTRTYNYLKIKRKEWRKIPAANEVVLSSPGPVNLRWKATLLKGVGAAAPARATGHLLIPSEPHAGSKGSSGSYWEWFSRRSLQTRTHTPEGLRGAKHCRHKSPIAEGSWWGRVLLEKGQAGWGVRLLQAWGSSISQFTNELPRTRRSRGKVKVLNPWNTANNREQKGLKSLWY